MQHEQALDGDTNADDTFTPEAEAEMKRIVDEKSHFDDPQTVYVIFLCSIQPNGQEELPLVSVHSTWEKAVRFCFRSEDSYLEKMQIDPNSFGTGSSYLSGLILIFQTTCPSPAFAIRNK